MFVPVKEGENLKLSDYSLILPAVSIGNVGQLAIDLVISSLSTKLIGYFYDNSLLPVVGNDAFASLGKQCGNLNLSTEVYRCEEHKLVIVQKRSPIAKGYQASYCRKLVEWIKQCGFQNVIMLSSVSAIERVDVQIKGSPLRYLTTSPSLKEKFDKLSWIAFEKRPSGICDEKDCKEGIYFMPGGGITKMFYEACCKDNIPLTVLMTFCSEGENIGDGVQLFLYLNQWLDMVDSNKVSAKFAGKPSDFKIPASWSLMFGSPIAHELLF